MKRIYLLVLVLFAGCTESTAPENRDDFDRGAFLQNYASEFIMPGYENLSARLVVLNQEIQNREDLADLSNVQMLWREAYLSFLKVTPYNFGPAGEEGLRKSLVEELATFPVDISKIEAKIKEEDLSTSGFDRDTRGFLGLEYLLFSGETQQPVKRLAYLKVVSKHLTREAERVTQEWEAYESEFVSNNGTAAGSSTSLFYNEFVKSFEALKNFKIGLPLGLRPGQVSALPENVESYYAAFSNDFAKQHFETIKEVWFGTKSLGFINYLNTVEGGAELVQRTQEQLGEVDTVFDLLSNEDYVPSSIENNENLLALHTELQKLTRFFKSEMSSVLGIAITFSSGDGD